MKFTIRDLFLVTVIVALVLGWLVDSWQRTIREASLKKANEMAEKKFSVLETIVERNGAKVIVEAPGRDGHLIMSVTPRDKITISPHEVQLAEPDVRGTGIATADCRNVAGNQVLERITPTEERLSRMVRPGRQCLVSRSR